MAQSKAERLAAVHERAMVRFDRCYRSQREIRLQCLQDRRFAFINGAQYEGDLETQFANRPRFEINKLHQSIIRIFSEYRNNRVTVCFRPDDKSSTDDNAEFLADLYRADEQESGAQEAYDTAFEEGVAGGMGAWRLLNRYVNEEDEDDDRRRIDIVPIPDADSSVFFDIDSKRYDKADAVFAFVISGLQEDDYGQQFKQGDATIARSEWEERAKAAKDRITSFNKVQRMGVFDWFQPSVIYVAEYYEIENTQEPVHFYKHPASGEEVKLRPKSFEEEEDFAEEEGKLIAQGFALDRAKKVKRQRVHKYLIDGNKVLEDCGYMAGDVIPVIPFYAKRLFVDNVERIMGHIRLATDAQRLYNMLITMLAEVAADFMKEKPIFYPAQIAGHEEMWSRDNIERYPYLLINPMQDPVSGQMMPPGPIAYTKAPAIPPALAGLLQLLGVDLQEVLGQSNNAQEVVSNISAKAVELIQNRLDMQNFIYMDNFKKSMKRCGEVWLKMARSLYDEEERPMRVVKEDGTDDVVKLRVPTKGEDDALTYTNDPAAGAFKVVADVGPSYTTRRDGTVRAVTGMLQFVEDPQDKAVLTSVAVRNMDGEGMEPVRKYYRRKAIALGLEEPTPEEAQEMAQEKANTPPSAQDQFLMAEAQKSLALAEKARADAEAALAKSKESEAAAAEKLAKIAALPIEQLLALVDRLPQNQAQAVVELPQVGAPS